MNKAEELRQKVREFLGEHGHITHMTGNYPGRTEKSYTISDETLYELMRVFAEQYAQQEYSRGFQDGMDEGYRAQLIKALIDNSVENKQVAKEAYNTARNNSPYIDFDDYWTSYQNQELKEKE